MYGPKFLKRHVRVSNCQAVLEVYHNMTYIFLYEELFHAVDCESLGMDVISTSFNSKVSFDSSILLNSSIRSLAMVGLHLVFNRLAKYMSNEWEVDIFFAIHYATQQPWGVWAYLPNKICNFGM